MNRKKVEDRSGRSRNAHLSQAEIESLQTDYFQGLSAAKAGKRIGCTRRTAQKYYALFRDECLRPSKPLTAQQLKPSRFYSSTFELQPMENRNDASSQ